MGILEVILLVGAAMIVLAIVIGFCCHCLHPQGKVKHCQRHNGPRILSPKLELSLKAETNANSNLAL